jgi:hypothetical protein
VIGLGAEDRMANIELACAFCPKPQPCAASIGATQRCAPTCRHVDGNDGLWLRLPRTFVDLQIARAACANGRASAVVPSAVLPHRI